jgi:drug/metabolite transporter (DMT)-like permease
MLTLLYGTVCTIVFLLLAKRGAVGSSPMLNAEPVAAMVLALALLGQRIAAVQVVGALVVVGTMMVLGLKKR